MITFEAAPGWYGARGNIGRVTMTLDPTPAHAGDQWRAGEHDVMYDVLVSHGAGITPNETTVAQHDPDATTMYLSLAANRSPLDDVVVRRALAHAIDRHGLTWSLESAPTGAGGMIPPSISGHSPRVAPAFDPDRAMELLRKAGHPGGRGLGELVLAHFGVDEEWGELIAAQLARVGFRVRRRICLSVAALLAEIPNVHLYFWVAGADSPDPAAGFLEPFYHWATWFYRDEQLDRLLARATMARDQDERLRLCREFERLWIGELVAVVPLGYIERLVWRRPWLTGFWANAFSKSSFAEAVVTRPEPLS